MLQTNNGYSCASTVQGLQKLYCQGNNRGLRVITVTVESEGFDGLPPWPKPIKSVLL
jgi:hypothetical protein